MSERNSVNSSDNSNNNNIRDNSSDNSNNNNIRDSNRSAETMMAALTMLPAADADSASQCNQCGSTSQHGSSAQVCLGWSGSTSTSRDAPSNEDSGWQPLPVDAFEMDDSDFDRYVMGDDYSPTRKLTLADLRYLPVNLSEAEIAERFASWEKRARSESRPSTIDRIGGMGAIMTTVWNTIRYPFDCPESCRDIRPKRGLILHGVTGVGKTMLIQALAEGCSRYDPKMTAFVYRIYSGKVENCLVKLFNKAKELRPSVIFLDMFDGLAHQDGQNVHALGAVMDELDDSGSVFVVAATDRLHSIDPEIRKSGRFDTEILIDFPDLEARKDILCKMTSTWDLQPSLIDLAANGTPDCTGADLGGLLHDVLMIALNRTYPNFMRYVSCHDIEHEPIDASTVKAEMEDFKEALRTFQSTKQLMENMRELEVEDESDDEEI